MGQDLRVGDRVFSDSRAVSKCSRKAGVVPGIRRIITPGAKRELAEVQTKSALTDAETEVLGWSLLRMTYKEIAVARGVSVNTVKSQMKTLLSKLGVESTDEIGRALSRDRGQPSAPALLVVLVGVHPSGGDD